MLEIACASHRRSSPPVDLHTHTATYMSMFVVVVDGCAAVPVAVAVDVFVRSSLLLFAIVVVVVVVLVQHYAARTCPHWYWLSLYLSCVCVCLWSVYVFQVQTYTSACATYCIYICMQTHACVAVKWCASMLSMQKLHKHAKRARARCSHHTTCMHINTYMHMRSHSRTSLCMHMGRRQAAIVGWAKRAAEFGTFYAPFSYECTMAPTEVENALCMHY